MNCPGLKGSGSSSARKSVRVLSSCSSIRSTRAMRSTAMAARVDVDREAWHDDLDLRVRVGDDGLAAEPRRGREADRFVEEIVLVFLRRPELVAALLHHDVAGRAGAAAAAGVLEEELVAEHHVEDRGGLAVVLEGRLARVELDHLVRLA